MIGCFPDPYPDELLYSVCARYKKRLLFLNDQSVSKILFGRSCSKFFINKVKETDLEYLISQLPPGHNYSVEKLIWGHTFKPLDQLGIRYAHSPNFLRYCRICFKEDMKQYGESYWRRRHQILGVQVCDVHKIPLNETNFTLCSYAVKELFAVPEDLSEFSRNVQNPLNSKLQELIVFADNITWLLHQKYLGFEEYHLRAFYVYILLNKEGLKMQASFDGEVVRFHKEYLVRAFSNWISDTKDFNAIFFTSFYNQLSSSAARKAFQEDFLRQFIDRIILNPFNLDLFQNLIFIQFLVGSFNLFFNAFSIFKKRCLPKYLAANMLKCSGCKMEWTPLESNLSKFFFHYESGCYLGELLCPNCFHLSFYTQLSFHSSVDLSCLKVSESNVSPSRANRHRSPLEKGEYHLYLSFDKWIESLN